MIDYGLLCHYIESWRTGQRPNPGYVQQAHAQEMEDVDSGVVVLEEQQGHSQRW